jgi:hypothetical protein
VQREPGRTKRGRERERKREREREIEKPAWVLMYFSRYGAAPRPQIRRVPSAWPVTATWTKALSSCNGTKYNYSKANKTRQYAKWNDDTIRVMEKRRNAIRRAQLT